MQPLLDVNVRQAGNEQLQFFVLSSDLTIMAAVSFGGVFLIRDPWAGIIYKGVYVHPSMLKGRTSANHSRMSSGHVAERWLTT